MAHRLKRGKTLVNFDYLFEIADEMARVYALMIHRANVGAEGTFTGLYDRNGRPIYIGDTVETNHPGYAVPHRFVVTYSVEQGMLAIPGDASDSSSWWTVVDKEAGDASV
jgi:hypothetical protein